MNLGGPEILVIIVVAILVLGPDKLPNALRMFGRTMGEVRKFQDMAKNEIEKAMDTSGSDDDEKDKKEEPSGRAASHSESQRHTEPSSHSERSEESSSNAQKRSFAKAQDDESKTQTDSDESFTPILDDDES